MIEANTRTAGIDTSKAKLDVAVFGMKECWQVTNTSSGWRKLAEHLMRNGVTRLGIEATGGYERGIVEHLRAAGFTVLVLQPIQVRAYARLHLRRAKNDKLDEDKALRSHDDLGRRFDLVLSIPGIGERTAIALIVRMPEPGCVGREGAAALAGLAPFDDDSGTHKGRRHIAGGRARLRRSLFAAALPAAFLWNKALSISMRA